MQAHERIALFVPTLGGGGAERVMLTLAGGFAASGIHVDLVVSKAMGELSTEVPSCVRLVDLGARRVITSVIPLVRYLRRERPVAMLSALCEANCISVWARALARVPVRLVGSEHSTLSVAVKSTSRSQDKLLPFLMRWSYPRLDTLIAVSSGVADDLAATIGFARHRIETIYNPVVTDNFIANSMEPIAHPWFRAGRPPVILGVGRLVGEKDFSTLIRAFVRLRHSQPARLLILGEGPERGALEAMARKSGFGEDIELPGFVSNPLAYMRAANVFVLSSRLEGLPTVLIEAMACGTPVVSTNCPSGPGEILQNGKFGLLVPVGDECMLARAIERWLVMPPTVAECHALVERANDFRLNEALDRYLQILRTHMHN